MATATEKGLTLSVTVNDDVQAQYWCADLLLKEVLINLLSNAVKFTEEGTVDLKVAVSKSSLEADHEVIFQVADSGPGIPRSLRKQVFSPFETGVSSATQGPVGTGLGLSMSEAHVQTMGGLSRSVSLNQGVRYSPLPYPCALRKRRSDRWFR